MKTKQTSWNLYFIVITILISISVQVYWNYKSYAENKKIFIQSVQQSLDNAVETYFSKIAKNEFLIESSNFLSKKKMTLQVSSHIDRRPL